MAIILGAGADINKQDNFKRAPLHHAAMNGNLVATKMLIEFGIESSDETKQRLLINA